MTESGLPPSAIKPASSSNVQPAARTPDVTVKLENGDLPQSQDRPPPARPDNTRKSEPDQSPRNRKIRGEVTETNPKTRQVKIRTPKGDITVRYPPDDTPLPAQGREVQITVQSRANAPQEAEPELSVRLLPQKADTLQKPLSPAPADEDSFDIRATVITDPAIADRVTAYAPPKQSKPLAPGQQAPRPVLEPDIYIRLIPLKPSAYRDIKPIPTELVSQTALAPLNSAGLSAIHLPIQPLKDSPPSHFLIAAKPQIQPPSTSFLLTDTLINVDTNGAETKPGLTFNAVTFQQTEFDTSHTDKSLKTVNIIQSAPANLTPFVFPDNGIGFLPNQDTNAPGGDGLFILPTETKPPSLALKSGAKSFQLISLSIAEPSIQITTPSGQVASHSFITQPQITQNTGPQNLTGEIIGQTPQKDPVIQMTLPLQPAPQLFILPVTQESAPNAAHILWGGLSEPALSVALDSPSETGTLLAQANVTSAQLTAIFPPVTLAPQPWPTLENLQTELARIAPQNVATFSQSLPSPASPQNLGPAILFFIAAVKGGDMQSWLGDRAVDAVKKGGKGTLLNRIGQEFSNLSRLFETPGTGEWRSHLLPLWWQNDIQQIALHVKRDADQDHSESKRKKSGNTRFVFDLNLSQMGRLQLDGLVNTGQGRMDMILRSEGPFSSAMRQDMRGLYSDALSSVDMTGDLSFETGQDVWLNIVGRQTHALGVDA